MRLSVITDEITGDLGSALGVCERLGIGTVELRFVAGRNIVEHDDRSVRRIAAMLAAGGFDCAVVDTPFLKTATPPQVEWDELERGLEVADRLAASTVRVFSGARETGSGAPGGSAGGGGAAGPDDAGPDSVRAWAAEILAEAVERTRRAGLGIALEIEFACSVATGLEARRLLDVMPGDGLGLVWDPGNESKLTGGPPDPAGYDAVREQIAHVHVKDVDAAGAWIRVGSGLVDWAGELRRLADGGYDGLLALETHYALPAGGAAAATRECADALRDLAECAGVDLR